MEENITQNIIELAETHKEIDFYYFVAPYSAAWWGICKNEGELIRTIEAERYAIELMLQEDNIYIYSFNLNSELTTNLNHYKDYVHYGGWINSYIIECISNDEYRINKENIDAYSKNEEYLYMNYDYNLLNSQIDYENDSIATELVKQFKQ